MRNTKLETWHANPQAIRPRELDGIVHEHLIEKLNEIESISKEHRMYVRKLVNVSKKILKL